MSVGMQLGLGTGFEFDDGRQLLVSVQKPIGMMLEQDTAAEGSDAQDGCIVAGVLDDSAASRAGIEAGYRLLAVNNMDVRNEDLDQVMDLLQRSSRVVNLRFERPSSEEAQQQGTG